MCSSQDLHIWSKKRLEEWSFSRRGRWRLGKLCHQLRSKGKSCWEGHGLNEWTSHRHTALFEGGLHSLCRGENFQLGQNLEEAGRDMCVWGSGTVTFDTHSNPKTSEVSQEPLKDPRLQSLKSFPRSLVPLGDAKNESLVNWQCLLLHFQSRPVP